MFGKPNLPQNPLLAELLAKNARGAITYMGYIGPEEHEDHIVLYENLVDLSKSIEIKKSDILHHVEAPHAVLPFGGVILWLKKDSEVYSRQLEGKDGISLINNASVSVKSDRLNLTIEKATISLGRRVPPPHPCHTYPCSTK